MSLLEHSIFQDVLFPGDHDDQSNGETQTFQLRRLKRFVAAPNLAVRSATLVVFDLETTGLDHKVDRIIEIGALKLVDLEPVAEFSTLVNTNIELTDDIIQLTGITPDMLQGQPQIEDVLPGFLEFIDGGILVAHNAEFDLGMIKAAYSRLGFDLDWSCFCTLKLARELLPDLERKNLDTLAEHYGLTFESRHRSIGDVKVTSQVLREILAKEGQHLIRWGDMTSFAVT